MSGWNVSKLGAVAEFIRGITFKPDDVVPLASIGSVACMRTKNVQTDLDLNNVWGVPEAFVKRADQFLREGDIVVSTANSWNLVGKCCWVPELPWPATIGGFVSTLRADTRKIFPRFLYHWLATDVTQARIRSCARQTTNIANLSIPQSLDIEIPLPPLEEQKRIAAILDQAVELRRKRQRALDRLNQLGQAIFIEMFGGAECDVSIFDYLDDIQSGKNLVGVEGDNGSGFRVLKISAVSRNGFRPGETKPLPSGYVPPPSHIVADGDLLFSRANTTELVGIPCIVDGVHENVALPDKLWRLVPSPKKAVSAFLCHALLSQSSRRQIERMCSGTSGSMQNISIEKFKRIQVPRASMSEQVKFRNAIEKVASAKHDLQDHSNGTDALFQVLQHRAFRGELTTSSLKEAAA